MAPPPNAPTPDSADPQATQRVVLAATPPPRTEVVPVPPKDGFPAPGTTFLGFGLIEELGRGAFGRVYLARQGDLAGRPVALKVAADADGESQTLAQLQHTNIVPIYSFHRVDRFQAVCMPFFGRTTLAQVVQHISGRPSLPSSGRELKSTVNRHGAETVPSARSSADAGHGAGPAADAPAPAQASDGWTRLDGLSYVGAVLWLGAQLADGLAHAHQRGILHLDLKPANVLLTDDGRPMLLDFNLSEDTKARDWAERAAVGGTLPYMAPEHLAAFSARSGGLDGRCDLFSLGVILFELLTGRHPYPVPKGPLRVVVAAMIADRQQPPSARSLNPAVSPAVDALVRKCLAADPAKRYHRAEQLREDIDRQLNNLPLRHAPDPSPRERLGKWARRHPRLTSSASVGAAAAVLLLVVVGGAVYARERGRDSHARAVLADHRAAFADAQLFLDDQNQSGPRRAEALERLRGVLERYGVPADGGEGWADADAVRRLPEGDRDRVRADVGETFFLMAQVAHLQALGSSEPADRAENLDRAAGWNAAAGRYAADRLGRAVREQGAALAALRGDAPGADRLRREAAAAPPTSPRDLYLAGAQHARTGRHREAVELLRKSTLLDPQNFSAWFVRGTSHLALAQDELAAVCFGACLAIRGDFAPAWLNRGLAFTRLRFLDLACDDYDRAVALDPALAEAYLQRAAAREARGDRPGAEEDLTRALETGTAPVRTYFLRAELRDRRGDRAGAAADRQEGLRHTPADELSWVGRAETRLADEPAGALSDVEEALKLNPFSVFGLQLKAHILAERLNRPDEALAALDRAVELHPDYAPARAGRGVVLARRGKRDEAVRDAREALLLDTRAPNLYQVGCIYALTSKAHPEDTREALRLLWGGLKTGFGLDLVDTDPDLDPLRADPAFRRLVANAKALHRARGQ